MASNNFIDYVKICCRSGSGGSGSMHFRREKFVDKGGPDGGDGGRGGHIILRGNKQLWTLLHLKFRKHITATDGGKGGSAHCSGKYGEDIYVDVPLGTVAKDSETGEQILEISEDGQELILVRGGRGGMGNMNFKTSTKQAPHYAQPGDEGIEQWIVMELKILADVGLVGLPNAGKSTLLSVLSAAKPEIADYPFTTIVPNLGVVSYRDFRSFVIADIPGIIEGAAEGKGLGTRFLRHIERNSVLLFMIGADSKSVAKEYKILHKELEQYNPELLHKQHLLAITKCDLLTEKELEALKKKIKIDIDTVFISAHNQMGLIELKDKLWNAINNTEE